MSGRIPIAAWETSSLSEQAGRGNSCTSYFAGVLASIASWMYPVSASLRSKDAIRPNFSVVEFDVSACSSVASSFTTFTTGGVEA